MAVEPPVNGEDDDGLLASVAILVALALAACGDNERGPRPRPAATQTTQASGDTEAKGERPGDKPAQGDSRKQARSGEGDRRGPQPVRLDPLRWRRAGDLPVRQGVLTHERVLRRLRGGLGRRVLTRASRKRGPRRGRSPRHHAARRRHDAGHLRRPPAPVYYVDDPPGQVLCHNVEEFGGLWLVVDPSGSGRAVTKRTIGARWTQTRVLVVDDEPMVRDVLSRYLERNGFEVDAVGDGERALAAFEAHRPDLVLLDLMLPKADGFEVFRRIRAQDDSPVIMITARGETTDGLSAWTSGPTTTSASRSRRARSSPGSARSCAAARVRESRGEDEGLALDGLELDRRSARSESRASRAPDPEGVRSPLPFRVEPARGVLPPQLLDEVWDVAFDGDPPRSRSTSAACARRSRPIRPSPAGS